MFPEIGESLHYQQAARCFRRREFFVLQNPSVAVGHEYGVEACRKRGIDVGLGTVSNHPRRIGRQGILGNYFSIRCSILLRDYLDGRKMLYHSRALNLTRLSSGV